MTHDNRLRLLAEMADTVDQPSGPGGGAIIRWALEEIERLRRLVLPRPEPTAV